MLTDCYFWTQRQADAEALLAAFHPATRGPHQLTQPLSLPRNRGPDVQGDRTERVRARAVLVSETVRRPRKSPHQRRAAAASAEEPLGCNRCADLWNTLASLIVRNHPRLWIVLLDFGRFLAVRVMGPEVVRVGQTAVAEDIRQYRLRQGRGGSAGGSPRRRSPGTPELPTAVRHRGSPRTENNKRSLPSAF